MFGDFRMKNTVYIIVIVACLLLAGIIGYKYSFSSGSDGGIESIPADSMIWVKCRNPACKAEYQMSERDFLEYQRENFDPLARVAPPLVCKECNEKSIYEAVKCANPSCGIVFERDSVPNDFSDRCPKCGFSKMEDDRKRALRGE